MKWSEMSGVRLLLHYNFQFVHNTSCDISRHAIDQMSAQYDAQARTDASNQTAALKELRTTLAEREEDLDQAHRDASNNAKQLVSDTCSEVYLSQNMCSWQLVVSREVQQPCNF